MRVESGLECLHSIGFGSFANPLDSEGSLVMSLNGAPYAPEQWGSQDVIVEFVNWKMLRRSRLPRAVHIRAVPVNITCEDGEHTQFWFSLTIEDELTC